MTESFFFDNEDLQFRLAQLDLREAIELKERATRRRRAPEAPRNYADATDNYKIVLEVLGEICAERVALAPPRRTRKALTSRTQGHLRRGDAGCHRGAPPGRALRAMLPREYGGLNLPESIYQ